MEEEFLLHPEYQMERLEWVVRSDRHRRGEEW